jgi:hypothetical protein
MRRERESLSRLQRSRRTAVDQDIDRQQEAIKRWSLRVETIVDSPAVPVGRDHSAAPAQPEPHEARVALVEPGEDMRRTLGDSCRAGPPGASARPGRPRSPHARAARRRAAGGAPGGGAPSSAAASSARCPRPRRRCPASARHGRRRPTAPRSRR